MQHGFAMGNKIWRQDWLAARAPPDKLIKRTRSSTGQSIGLRNRGLGVQIPPGVLDGNGGKQLKTPGQPGIFSWSSGMFRWVNRPGIKGSQKLRTSEWGNGAMPAVQEADPPSRVALSGRSDGHHPKGKTGSVDGITGERFQHGQSTRLPVPLGCDLQNCP